MSEAKFQMSINLQVLNHLGLNLYSNTSAVLSEVVANAWDADATDVKIQIDGDTISIADNGIGMNLLDINNKYLRNAQNLYSDFLEQNKNLSTLSNIINELEMG